MPGDDPEITAHAFSIRHRRQILDSSVCGCFYCTGTFLPAEIVRWVDDQDGVGQTALCPYCSIDSVIGSASGYEISKEFLTRMHDHWF
jgi:hypothetical protein